MYGCNYDIIMSSLTNIAQCANRFAQNIMGYEYDKKKEAERVTDNY